MVDASLSSSLQWDPLQGREPSRGFCSRLHSSSWDTGEVPFGPAAQQRPLERRPPSVTTTTHSTSQAPFPRGLYDGSGALEGSRRPRHPAHCSVGTQAEGSPQLEVDQPDLTPMPGDSRWGQPSCHWVLLGAVAVTIPILVMCPKGLLDHVASGLGLKPGPSAATSVFRTTRQDCLS